MKRDSRDAEFLAELLAEQAREDAEAEGADLGSAPEPEELLDLLEDRLPPEDAERLERRVIADPEAARAFLDLADFAEAEASMGAERPPEVATHAGWRDFESRLQEETPGSSRRTPPPPWLLAVAAGLLAAVVGLGAWVWTLSDAEPFAVAHLTSLELAAETRGEEAVISLAPGAPLRLVLAPAERCPAYRASIRWTGPSGASRSRTLEGLVRDDLGRVTLLVSGEPGAYVLELSGCEPPRELERHRFRVVPESDGG